MSKIYRGEMQDDLGNTIYPHTEAGLVYCSDGETVQVKIAGTAETLDGITGVSDSTELDDSTKLATSKAVNTLRNNVNSSLKDNSGTSESFNYGVKNGVRGFYTTSSRADDSFVPFKNAKFITPDNGIQIVDFGFKPQYFIAIQNTAGYYIIYDLENNKQIDNHNVPFDPTATSVSFDKNFFIFNQNKTGLEKIYYYSTAWKWHICVL